MFSILILKNLKYVQEFMCLCVENNLKQTVSDWTYVTLPGGKSKYASY